MTTEPIMGRTVDLDPKPDYFIEKRCIHCKGTTQVGMTANHFHRWHVQGEFTQNVWPKATPDEREALITGIHPECWAVLFPPGDEE